MSSKARSDKGENKTDGFDFELFTKVDFINVLRDRKDVVDYKIGKKPGTNFGALDDVVCNVTFPGNRELIYVLQAKQTMKEEQPKSDKLISSQELWVECGKKNYYVPKYLASYLSIKQHTPPEKLQEMIIWTTQSIADTAMDSFEPYVTDREEDILKSVTGSDIQRWKLNPLKLDHPEYGDLKQLLLDEVHPLKSVVDKFVTVMFKKETWHSGRAARSCFRIMAKEVIDCDKKIFRDNFLKGDASLSSHTQIFRRVFERAMKLKIRDFSMNMLNSEDYKRHFTLQIDDQFTKGSDQCSWNVEDGASQCDLEDFIIRFVFYVNVPKVVDFGNKLVQKFGTKKFKELCSLVKPCTMERMAAKAEIDAIFNLLLLQSKTNLKKDPVLNFENDDDGLRRALEDANRIFIEAAQDIECSVNRVLMTEEFENKMQPCLAFRYRNFVKWKSHVIAVIKQSIVCEHGLRGIIVSDIDEPSITGLLKELETFKGKVIFLSEKVTSEHVEELGKIGLSYFKDEFDVDKLTLECKSVIFSKEIKVFDNNVTVEDLFSNDFIRKDNFKLVMKLYRQPASECFQLGRNKLVLEPYFDSRLKELASYYESPIILSDHAGMGKTTEMFNIANNIREQRSDCLAVYLDCITAVKLFREEGSVDVGEKLINMVCAMIHVDFDKYQKLIVREMFRSGSVFLLLDGYDEVSDRSQHNLEEMIAACAAANLRGLFIATRPHCLERIQLKLGQAKQAKVYKLHSFSEKERVEYLMKTWNVPPGKKAQVEENAEILINTFQTVFKQEGLLGIPLQMKMISSIYAEEITSDSFEPPKNFQMGSIVASFVQRRLDMVIAKYKTDGKAQELAFQQTRKEFPADHVKMALSVYQGSIEHIKELFVKNETYGLVRLNPFETFCHETYLSYFLALYFITHRAESDEFKQYMKRYLCPNRTDIATKLMDFHLGNLIRDAESDRNPDAIQLHKDKIDEFRRYQAESCTETERFTLIRNSLNATAFNVFDVLYSSLTESDLRKLRFRYGGDMNPNQNRHLINLKRLGGDQTLQLLGVLSRKAGATFVAKILTNFSIDEEDFIEVACRKPFLQVFEWLFERVPAFVAEERVTLLEYARERMATYLKVVVQHNNALLLEEIIIWAQHNWPKDVLATWLENCGLLLVFVSNVGQKCTSKKLLVDSRILMVKMVHQFLTWTYNDHVMLPEPFLRAISTIEQVEIKNAFIQLFGDCCQ